MIYIPPPAAMRWRILNWPPMLRRCIALIFFGLVNWLLLAPARTFRDVHVMLAKQDKLAHLLVFAGVAWLFRWSIPETWVKGRLKSVFLLGLLAYGIAAESLQPMLTRAGRAFEWGDLLMNLVGIIIGLLLFKIMARHSPPAPSPP